MRSLDPPRSRAAGRKPSGPARRPPAGARPARAPLQFVGAAGARREEQAPAPAPARRTDGLPEGLQTVMEAMSGFSLADVVVHRNSAEPARLGALAYTKGSEIHLGPGQERHLPHEAWHVVQQAQGRVRPTKQLKRGAAVNDDSGLEHEADVMGAKALWTRAPEPTCSAATLRCRPSATSSASPVQAFLDDLLYPNRKMGVEVTESTAGENRIETANSNAAFGLLGAAAQAALWQNVNLPDHTGAAHVWHAAPTAAVAAFFDFDRDKHAWMRWANVSMTEDFGEFEWILHHPAAPQNMSYYRNELNQINQSRQQMRAALAVVGGDLVVAPVIAPAAGQAFRIRPGATNDASAQVTFESTSAATTKRVLYEGLSHGLNKRVRPNRETLANATPDIVTAAQASAGRFAFPGVDKELLMAYLYGDLIHKMATMIDGVSWAGGMAAIDKGWRNLFPKSKPFQVTMQAVGHQPTAAELAMLTAVLNGARAAILQDILGLFATKLTSSARVTWDEDSFAAPDPGGHIFNAANAGIAPLAGAAALVPALTAFLVANGVDPAVEYDHVRDGFITPAAAFVPQVVRSSDVGFAQHGAGTSGFATEDRGEIATTFPNLDTVYARIKTIARRF